MAEPVRLQKYLSDCGTLSRRAAEQEMRAGHISVNGAPAAPGIKIDPETDVVQYRGRRVLPRGDKPHVYIMLYKPRGIVCSSHDEKGRPTVTDLVKIPGIRLYPVGRLDMDSEGLLLLTDDGAFTNHLTHPRHEIPKRYHVTLTAPPSKDQLYALSQPMFLDGYRLLPVGVRQISTDTLEMTLREGRNRQIRRMCENVGLTVKELIRVSIGKLTIDSLLPGSWRKLTPREVAYLYPPANSE